jgi:hypothetical protein
VNTGNLNLPPFTVLPDKVRVTASYDNGMCTAIDVILNYDGISREDIESTIEKLAASAPDGEVLVAGHAEHRQQEPPAKTRGEEIAATQRMEAPGGDAAATWRASVAAPKVKTSSLWRDRP